MCLAFETEVCNFPGVSFPRGTLFVVAIFLVTRSCVNFWTPLSRSFEIEMTMRSCVFLQVDFFPFLQRLILETMHRYVSLLDAPLPNYQN
jgi:hypothetical protein